ncbi:protein of unknown function [Burkholderia multivorans]
MLRQNNSLGYPVCGVASNRRCRGVRHGCFLPGIVAYSDKINIAWRRRAWRLGKMPGDGRPVRGRPALSGAAGDRPGAGHAFLKGAI